jgi:hypothetical protein
MDEECRKELRQLIEDKKEGLVASPELLKLRATALERSLTRQAKGGVCGGLPRRGARQHATPVRARVQQRSRAARPTATLGSALAAAAGAAGALAEHDVDGAAGSGLEKARTCDAAPPRC